MPDLEMPNATAVHGLTPAETCGNCKWGRKTDQMLGPEAMIECWGAPPTAQAIGQNANGLSIMLLRPNQAAKTPRCGLWAAMRRILDS